MQRMGASLLPRRDSRGKSEGFLSGRVVDTALKKPLTDGKVPNNFIQQHIWPLKHKFILKTQNPDAEGTQACISFCIMKSLDGVVMDCSIHFYGQLLCRTIEIKNVIFNTVLPAEFAALKAFAFQDGPEAGFGGCQVPPQLLPPIL